jgi:hypothetical protein
VEGSNRGKREWDKKEKQDVRFEKDREGTKLHGRPTLPANDSEKPRHYLTCSFRYSGSGYNNTSSSNLGQRF